MSDIFGFCILSQWVSTLKRSKIFAFLGKYFFSLRVGSILECDFDKVGKKEALKIVTFCKNWKDIETRKPLSDVITDDHDDIT